MSYVRLEADLSHRTDSLKVIYLKVANVFDGKTLSSIVIYPAN